MNIKFQWKGKEVINKFRKWKGAGLREGLFSALRRLDREVVNALYTGKYGVKQRHGASGLVGSFSQVVMGGGQKQTGIYGSKLIYAKVQEEGKRIMVKSDMAKFAWYKYYSTGNVMWKAIALLKGKRIMIPSHYYLKNSLDRVRHSLAEIIRQKMLEKLA